MFNNKPLYILALEKRLPKDQCIDPVTQFWCYSMYSSYMGITQDKLMEELLFLYTETRSNIDNFFKKYELNNLNMLCASDRKETIHGVRHHVRTALLGYILAIKNKLDENIQNEIVVSCLIHDLFRLNDQDDLGHGKRASDWYEKNFEKTKDFIKGPSRDFLCYNNDIARAIELHDAEITESKNQILFFLKKSDALDRFRLPKIKWWPNKDKNYLVTFSHEELLLGILLNILIPEFVYKDECTQ